MVTWNLKMISIESVFTNNLTFINPYNALFGWNLKKIPVFLVYWLAVKQQTHKCRYRKYHYIYWKLSLVENELILSFNNALEVAWKLQKSNNAWKKKIYVFRGLRVKALVTNLQKDPKQSFFVFTWSMGSFNLKMISIKSVFINNLTFINPWIALFG